MNLIQLLAHSDDLHTSTTSDLEHTLTSTPVALPFYIILNIVVFQALKRFKKSLLLPTMLGMNLLIGLLSFELVPVVSIIAITAGIASALLVSLALIAK